MSTNKQKYNKKYGFKNDEGHSKAALVRTTGIPKRLLDKVYYRGVGARKSNAQSVRSATSGKKIGGSSLRGKMSAAQWGYGRLYSFLMRQAGTWSGADKDIADEVKKLKIKGYMR